MAYDYEAGGDLSTGGSWLAEPGTYHLIVESIDEQPTSKDGTLVPNAAFRVNCSVCDGTVGGQRDKTTDITFFRPKATDKNEGAFAKKKIDRFLLAVGLVTEQQVLDKARVSIDLQQAVGRQFIAKLDKEKEDSKFLSLSFADVYHVDDPAVAAIPRSKDHLSMIDAKLRRLPQSGGPSLTPASAAKGASGAKAKAASQAATVAPQQPAAYDYSDV